MVIIYQYDRKNKKETKMQNEIKVGDYYQRLQGDKKIVRIVVVDGDLVEVRDSNGNHFVPVGKFIDHFNKVVPLTGL